MRLQRMGILFLVLALVVGLEVILMTRCTVSGETVSAPTVTPPQSTADVSTATTPTAIPTVIPTMPGFTSPPGGSGASTGSSNNNNSSSNNNNSSSNNNKPKATQAPATPKPTEKPQPTQRPGTSLGSGDFSSNTGTNLNMNVSWEARDQGDGKCRVYITGTVNSYRLSVSSKPVSISFGGYSTSVNSSKVNVSSNDSMVSSSLFSTYLDVPSGTEGTMTVVWKYNGTYHDEAIDEIEASGSVWTS